MFKYQNNYMYCSSYNQLFLFITAIILVVITQPFFKEASNNLRLVFIIIINNKKYFWLYHLKCSKTILSSFPPQINQKMNSHLNFKRYCLDVGSHQNKLFNISSSSYKIFGHYLDCILKNENT